jgi:transcriptional antiterminator RfaH
MTKPNSEGIAEANLTRQGYIAYIPRFITKVGKEIRIKPLFPRYIFISIQDRFHSINSTIGISYLIMNKDVPATVPDSVIDTLKAREDKRGLITLPEKGKFSQGENVKLVSGALSGYDGLYEGMSSTDRCRVLIELLGRKVIIEVSEGSISAVASKDRKLDE